MNKNEIVKLRVMQVEDRDVPAKYIEAFNSYLDKVVIPHFEKQLAEKDKEIVGLKLDLQDAFDMQDVLKKKLKVQRHQICEKIREKFEQKINEAEKRTGSSISIEYVLMHEGVGEFEWEEILDQIEKGEKKC